MILSCAREKEEVPQREVPVAGRFRGLARARNLNPKRSILISLPSGFDLPFGILYYYNSKHLYFNDYI